MSNINEFNELKTFCKKFEKEKTSLPKFLSKLTVHELFNYCKCINDSKLCKDILFSFDCCNLSCNTVLSFDEFVFEFATYLELLTKVDIFKLIEAKDKYLTQKKGG